MKRIQPVIIFCISILAIMLVGCGSEKKEIQTVYEFEISDAIEVDMNSSKYVFITSEKELKNLFKDDAKSIKSIDFKTYNLLYVQGKTSNGISSILSKCVSSEHTIDVYVDIECLLTCEYSNWNQGFLIPKSMGNNVSVNINCNIH